MLRTGLSKPSTTITAATLAMSGATLLTEIALQAGFELRPTLAAAFVTFCGGAFGYFVRENVLPIDRGEDETSEGVG